DRAFMHLIGSQTGLTDKQDQSQRRQAKCKSPMHHNESPSRLLMGFSWEKAQPPCRRRPRRCSRTFSIHLGRGNNRAGTLTQPRTRQSFSHLGGFIKVSGYFEHPEKRRFMALMSKAPFSEIGRKIMTQECAASRLATPPNVRRHFGGLAPCHNSFCHWT